MQQKADVLVQRNAQLFGTLKDILPAHSTGERLVLQLLLDAGDLEILQTTRWSDQGAGDEKTSQLVHREQGAGHGRVPRHPAVGCVAEDGVLHGLGKSPGGEQTYAFGRVLLCGRM